MNTNLRAFVPNLLTLCNLLCGCVGIWLLFAGHPGAAGVLVFVAALFDVFDGMAARMLGVSGPLGVQLDSLADVVSFGVLPSFMAFTMMRAQALVWSALAFVAFLMALCSAYRLAKFNIDPAQKKHFSGMPTPVNAVFWASLCLHQARSGQMLGGYYVLILSLMFAVLLVCPWRMFSLKSKDWSWQGRKFFYIYVAFSIVALCVFGFLGICVAVVFYPVFSYLHYHMGNGDGAHGAEWDEA
ncbi:MAG: CDP-alcohol phosphatidyltransferase family protein [Bacteroidales bacterium]|nr:CDP-alcohol phosphatidyltransferase family protein [Bacteroidales bacterium]